MKIIATPLEGLLIIEPVVFEDERGYFLETHHFRRFQSADIDCTFVQDNLSFSGRNILRGLHFQKTKPQAKLVQAVSGEIFDVGVDLRLESATFGKWSGIVLSEEDSSGVLANKSFWLSFLPSKMSPLAPCSTAWATSVPMEETEGRKTIFPSSCIP